MPPKQIYKLYLYLAGQTAKGTDPVERNIKDCLETIVGEDYSLEIIEVVKNPQSAIEEGVLFTPTLLRVLPEPKKRVVGNFLDKARVMETLMLLHLAPSD